ncbi:MAG: HD domain-containing protein [Bacteroidaceae bacterium]|mgnify:FL=1|nr:HD domain-containing protein [Bacteroidaceae bacterium]
MIDGIEQQRRENIKARYEQHILPKFQNYIEKNKAEFKSICEQYVTSERKASLGKIFDYLEKTDFYTAPSSTMFHLNCPGGLCKHSINVFKTAKALNDKLLAEDIESKESIVAQKFSDETIAVAALFHDLCKIGMYYPEEKFTKDGKNWIKYLGWGIDDQLPMGHAEKSLYRLSCLIRLTTDEILAIRWHMGMFDMGEKGSSLRTSFYQALDQSALVILLQCADNYASRCLEQTYDLTTFTL